LEWVGSGGEVPSVEERDGERFLVHGEKWGGYRGSVGDDFIPCMTIFFFCYWGGDRETAEVALNQHMFGEGLVFIPHQAISHGPNEA
jgi:hypothetical protein